MTRSRIKIIQIIIGLALLIAPFANNALAQKPVVYGVFFYSRTCPHCHDVIVNHWPGIQETFGDQLQVLFVDIAQPEGSQTMQLATRAMGIASNGVPMLIIGDRVLVGSADIPQRAPGIIQAGLDAGGIGYPPIPNIERQFSPGLDQTPLARGIIDVTTQFDDPANIAAVVVLLGAIAGLVMTAVAAWQRYFTRNQQVIRMMDGTLGNRMVLIGAVIGIGLTASLAIGSLQDPLPLVLSSGALLAFIVLTVQLLRSTSVGQLASWLTPLTIVAGLLAAGYLATIEVSQTEATCGVIGNCNAVSQSAYAQVFGIPVAVIGIVGYLLILGLWLISQVNSQRWIDGARFITILAGVGFTTYLTFVEPFIIQESCVWCLTSAVVMVILLWMTVPAGLNALFANRHSSPARRSTNRLAQR